jgi:HEAT repeat protein
MPFEAKMSSFRPPVWGGIPSELPIAELANRLKKPGTEAWAAITALAQNPSSEAFQLLVQCAASSDWTFRRIAIEALSHHALAGNARTLICAALRDSSPYVVRTACEAVGRLQFSEAHDDLRRLLSSVEAATRAAAIRALHSLWQPDDFAPVFRLSLSDPAQFVRREAAWLLRETAQSTTWRELFEAWKNAELPRLRFWACQLAELYGSDGVRLDLERLTKDRDGHVRKAAGKALRAGSNRLDGPQVA